MLKFEAAKGRLGRIALRSTHTHTHTPHGSTRVRRNRDTAINRSLCGRLFAAALGLIGDDDWLTTAVDGAAGHKDDRHTPQHDRGYKRSYLCVRFATLPYWDPNKNGGWVPRTESSPFSAKDPPMSPSSRNRERLTYRSSRIPIPLYLAKSQTATYLTNRN